MTANTHYIRRAVLRVVLLAMALALFAIPCRAQYYFGKNKVQYTSFDWQVMTTEHFNIYFYKEEADIARIAAQEAETAYDLLSARFNHEVKRRIPLIIYSSPSYFSQTNVIPGLLPESVGGFTEFLKGRVVIPFHGSYYDFVHVIRHEMVHVFQLDKMETVTSRQARIRYGYLPLWFTEGLAEFWSKEWDTEADMILKDLVIDGQLPAISDLYVVQGTYFMYKIGESICQFIDSTYGPDKLVLLFDNWPKGRDFDDVVQLTLGDNLGQVSQKWHYALKRKYFPEIQDLGLPKMDSRQVNADGYAVKGVPIHWDDGTGAKDWIIFKANRLGYTGIYMKPAGEAKGPVKTLVKGERSARFESLYLLRSGIDAHDSGLVIFSSKSKERDVIYLYDLNREKIIGQFQFEDLVAALSPRFSSDARQVVFSGMKKSGYSDLYVLDLKSSTYRTLTSDIYYDADPAFTPDGSKVVFSSDRASSGMTGAINLFELDLSDRSIRQLTFGHFRDQSAQVTADGIYFSSDRLGTYNLFALRPDGSLSRQSTYVTGAFDPRPTHNDSALVFTGYQDQMFQIYQMPLLKEPLSVTQVATADSVPWQPRRIDATTSQATISYEAKYSFDIAQSSVAYDPIYGSIGGLQAAISDVLGNKAFHFLLTNTARTNDQLLSSFNLGVTYINREKQLNWGVGAFHLFNEYYNDFDGYYFERQAGGLGLFSYPVSKFQRFDFTTFGRYSKKDRSYGLNSREVVLLSNYVSWIYDNSLWDVTGPLEGRRYNLTVGLTTSLNEGKVYNRLAFGDIRHYFRLGKYSAFANRLFAYSSSGIEPQRIYLGGSWSFRGFDRRAFYNRNILFSSTELRFPLIDALVIGFPFGGLGFQGIRGALFYDTGAAWDDEFDRFYGSFGAGFRVNLGYIIVLRFDFSRTTDYRTISPSTDFDFFFGWNF
ncbi:MAG: hypothetical protein AB1644_01125 [Candidatus Zixiibacteriota bacterium]